MSASGGKLWVARAAALVVAVGFVVGAWYVRTNVIDDDEDTVETDGSSAESGTTAWCLPELAVACDAAFADDDVDVRIVDADAGLDELAAADVADLTNTVWVTFAGLPEAADLLRTGPGREALDADVDEIAQSPIVGVSPGPLSDECAADPFGCDATAGFSRPDHTAMRWIATTVVLDQVLEGGLEAGASSLAIVEARPILTALPESRLSNPSAIATMCSRPTFDLALGADAERTACVARDLEVSYSDAMSHAVVVVATLAGGGAVDEAALRSELTSSGWEPYADGRGPDGADLLVARTIWSQM